MSHQDTYSGRKTLSDLAQTVFVGILTLFPNFDKRRARKLCNRWKYVLSKKLAIMRQLFLPINESVVMRDELLSTYTECCVTQSEESVMRSFIAAHSRKSFQSHQSYGPIRKSRPKVYTVPVKTRASSRVSRAAARRLSEISRIIRKSDLDAHYSPDSSGAPSPRRSLSRTFSKGSVRAEGPMLRVDSPGTSTRSKKDVQQKRDDQNYLSLPSGSGRDRVLAFTGSDNSLNDFPCEEPIQLSSPLESPPPASSPKLQSAATDPEEPDDRIADDLKNSKKSEAIQYYNHWDDIIFRSHGIRRYNNANTDFQLFFPVIREPAPREPCGTCLTNRSAQPSGPLSVSCATCTTKPDLKASLSPLRATSYSSDLPSYASSSGRYQLRDYDNARNSHLLQDYRSHYSRMIRSSSSDIAIRRQQSPPYGGHSSKYMPHWKPKTSPPPHPHHSQAHGQQHHAAQPQTIRAIRHHKGYIEHRFHRRRPKKTFQPYDIEPFLKHQDPVSKQRREEQESKNERKSRFDHHSNFPNSHKVKRIKTSRNTSSKYGEPSKRVVVTKRKRSRK